MSQLIVKSAASKDLLDHFLFLAEQSETTAFRFFESAEKTFQELLEMPLMGRECVFKNADLSGVRRWRVRGFEKYLIFYQVNKTDIEIIRVIYGSRDIQSIFEEE